MSEVAEQTLDEIAKLPDVFEEAIDGTVEVIDAVRAGTNFKIIGASLFVAGALVGGTAAYIVAKKQLKSFYEDLAREEIADAKEFYKGLHKTNDDGAVLTPQQVMEQRHGSEAAVAALRTYQGEVEVAREDEGLPEGEPYDDVMDEEHLRKMEARLLAESKDGIVKEEVTVTEKVETVNVFSDPTFDLDEEMKYRTEDKPYIITHDEYFAAEKDYDTLSYTYFEVDGVLTDEQDQPVEESDKQVGDNHLVRFGHGSKDKNTVYVRNDKLQVDYEITRSTGSYLEEVLGMPDEEPNSLKHSDQRDRRRAFRHGDE